jgi:hypothetical protein
MLNVPDVPAVSIPENITSLLRHLHEGSIKGVVDREHAHGVVLCPGQNDETALQLDVVPFETHDLGAGNENKIFLPIPVKFPPMSSNLNASFQYLITVGLPHFFLRVPHLLMILSNVPFL